MKEKIRRILAMEYTEFKELVEERFNEFLPDKYKDMEVVVRKINKINKEMDGISLKTKICPTIYINDLYDKYLKIGDFESVISMAAEGMAKALESVSDIDINFDDFSENVIFMLVNTNQNKEWLKNVPHREFLDLSIIYRWIINADENGMKSSVVNNSLAEHLGYSEEQLFNLAKDNTRRINIPEVIDMSSAIKEMMLKDGMPEEMLEEVINEEKVKENYLWVIGNKNHFQGAASIAYEDILYELAEKLDSDLYILPSSIHECIAVKVEKKDDPSELQEMVKQVNCEVVEIGDKLSDNIYFYDRKERKLNLMMVTKIFV